MLGNIVKQEIIFYVMGILLGFSVIAKIISMFTNGKMVKAAGEIHKSNHRLMKLVKSKFEHASLVSDKVQNVEAFVDKYLYEYKVWGIRLHTWRAIPKKTIWLIGILGVFAVFESYRMEGMGDLTMKYVQWTGLFLLFILLLHFVAEEQSQLQVAKNYMVEYLENVCIHRYAKINKAMEEAGQDEPEEIVEEETEKESEDVQAAKQLEEEQKQNEREMKIRAILEEFLA